MNTTIPAQRQDVFNAVSHIHDVAFGHNPMVRALLEVVVRQSALNESDKDWHIRAVHQAKITIGHLQQMEETPAILRTAEEQARYEALSDATHRLMKALQASMEELTTNDPVATLILQITKTMLEQKPQTA